MEPERLELSEADRPAARDPLNLHCPRVRVTGDRAVWERKVVSDEEVTLVRDDARSDHVSLRFNSERGLTMYDEIIEVERLERRRGGRGGMRRSLCAQR